jgi:SSS family solute:Na+ symporter
VAAIFVNDIYKPIRPEATDKQMLSVARWSSIGVTLFGVLLVPLFMQFDSIYSAHGAFTAAVTPPLVVALFLGVFWKGFSQPAAFWTMVGGTIAIALSLVWPELITPFAHGVPMMEVDDSFLAGKNQYKFMRAFYGLVVCTAIGLTVNAFTKGRDPEELKGLVWGTVGDAIRHFKGKEGTETESDWVLTSVGALDADAYDAHTQLSQATITSALADAIQAEEGDLVYVTDPRAWLGGLRSGHVRIDSIEDSGELRIVLGPGLRERIGPAVDRAVKVKRLY